MPSTRTARSPERLLSAFLRRHRIPRGARILAAFSGGPDSRALLELLAGQARKGRLELQAAYLDHGLRPDRERERELQFVRRTCAGLGVPLEAGVLPPGELAASRGGRSLEELARERRYRFLLETAERLGFSYIALGHTADDQAETLIMRFFQGAGPGGLSGIPARRGKIIRPLLECSRADLRRWLAERGLEYSQDSTNLDTAHLRNAVRLRLLPVLQEVFPGYRRSLAALAAEMRSVKRLLEDEAKRRLPWRREGEGFAIEADALLRAPAPLRRLSLYPLLALLGAGRGRLPAGFLQPGALCGRGVRLERRGIELLLLKDIVGAGKKGYLIAVEPHRRYAVPSAGWRIEFGAGVSTPSAAAPVVRSGTPADRLPGGRMSVAVRKLFSAWRLPHTERWRVPIMADRTGVLAVLGRCQGGEDRFAGGQPAAAVAVLPVPREDV
jgi:tRNA(Ile)-lysidine synthase